MSNTAADCGRAWRPETIRGLLTADRLRSYLASCDAPIKQLGQESYSSAKRAMTVLRWHSGWLRHEVLTRSPVNNVSRLRKPKRTPDALSPVQAKRDPNRDQVWKQTRGTCDPHPDDQLGQVVEVMLGTSARIGEVLSTRRRDVV